MTLKNPAPLASSAAARKPWWMIEWPLGFPYSIIFAIVGLAMAVPAWHRPDTEWGKVFVPAARRLLAGENFYLIKDSFVYPPFTALMAAPFTFLSDRASRVTWYAICFASLVVLVRLAWRLAGGRVLRVAPRLVVAEHAAFILGLAVALRYALNALSHTQTDLLIDALLLIGCLAAVRGRFVPAAIWWGLGAAFKGPPLLLAFYLLWRRKWVAAACMIAVTIGVNLLPNLVSHAPDGGLWLRTWQRNYLKPMGAGNVPGAWNNALTNNQSVAGALNRWLTTTPVLEKHGVLSKHRPGAPSASFLRAVNLSVDGALALLAAVAMWQGRRRIRRSLGDDPAAHARATVLDCALFLCLTLLLSPMTSRSHYAILLLPAFLVTRAALVERSRFAWAMLVIPLLTTFVALNLGISRQQEDLGLWFGSVTLSGFTLMLGCAWMLLQPENVDRWAIDFLPELSPAADAAAPAQSPAGA